MSKQRFVEMSDGTRIRLAISDNGFKKWVVVVHGIGEHLGRHEYMDELFENDYNILRFDLRGHGKSGKRISYKKNFFLFMEDLLEITNYLKSDLKAKAYALYGHSMGASIVTAFLQNYVDVTNYPACVFYSSPYVEPYGILGKISSVTPMNQIAKIPLSFGLKGIVDVKYLSHDPRVRQIYLKDRLNTLTLNSKIVLGLVHHSKEIFSKRIYPMCPAFCAIGDSDRVVSVDAVKKYFKKLETKFKLRVFKGAYHEIYNEIEGYKKPYLKYLKKSIKDSMK